MVPSCRSIVHLLSLKSKRVPISRVIPASALSTSARSIRETISKLGTAALQKKSCCLDIACRWPQTQVLDCGPKGACRDCEPGLGRYRRHPVEEGARCGGGDL